MNISGKRLKKLPKNIPNIIKGNFECDNNNLTSLKGSPKEVGGDFYCSYNRLITLEGGPEKVGGSFYCSFNPKLPLLEIIKFIFASNIQGEIISDYDNNLINKINKVSSSKYEIIKVIFKI